MNIFRVFTTILYPFFIYLLLFSRRNLLESTDTSASHNPATDGSGQVATTPANPNGSSSASGGSGNATGGGTTTTTPTSGGGTKGSGTKTGVELSLKATAPTDQFDHNKNDKIVIFTAKGDHGFKSVKTGDKAVWSTTDTNEYATKVILDGKGKKNKIVAIYLPNNTIKVLKREGKSNPWKELDTKGNSRSVNIKYEQSSFFYTNTLNNNIRTFQAREGFHFNGAFENVNNKKVEIWKTDKESEYSNKIVKEGDKKVTFYIGDGTNAKTKVFTKGSDNNWTEDTKASTQNTANSGGGAATTPSSGATGTGAGGGTTTTTPTSGGGTDVSGTPSGGNDGGATGTGGGGSDPTSGGGATTTN